MIDLESSISKGRRVRSARALVGLSRAQFYDRYRIHFNTLKSWESPIRNQKGLSRRGAVRLIKALNKEGVTCDIEWLLAGKGQGLQYIDAQTVTMPTIIYWSQGRRYDNPTT